MPSFPSRRALLAGVAGATLALTGCSTGATGGGTETASSTTEADASAFPVTIEHAFGETTIESEPKRVATLGWGDQDTALALGVVPVGATKLTWGGNEGGSSAWFDAAVEEAGAEAPVRYDDADGAPVEEIAKLSPDVILATNSGITEEEYAKLSEIAPVVAYPEGPWITDWRTSLATVGEALGRSDQAAELKTQTEDALKGAQEDHPEIVGASLIFGFLTPTDLSSVGVYGPQDPRVALMHDLGLEDAPAVDGAIKEGEFYGTVSAERAASLESDVFLTWEENAGDMAKFAANPLIGKVPAIAEGRAYAEADKQTALAVTNPTPLSIPHVIENFVPGVAKAVEGA